MIYEVSGLWWCWGTILQSGVFIMALGWPSQHLDSKTWSPTQTFWTNHPRSLIYLSLLSRFSLSTNISYQLLKNRPRLTPNLAPRIKTPNRDITSVVPLHAVKELKDTTISSNIFLMNCELRSINSYSTLNPGRPF